MCQRAQQRIAAGPAHRSLSVSGAQRSWGRELMVYRMISISGYFILLLGMCREKGSPRLHFAVAILVSPENWRHMMAQDWGPELGPPDFELHMVTGMTSVKVLQKNSHCSHFFL